MSLRKKSDACCKRQLKEKIVQMYEIFLKGEELLKEYPNFWDEFFLMKPNVCRLEGEIQKLSKEQLVQFKININSLFAECVQTLGHEHPIRVLYSLQTLCAVTSSVYRKISGECAFDLINVLIGFDVSEKRIHCLFDHLNRFLLGKTAKSVKKMSLKLLIVMVTGTDNVSQNTLLEYFMLDNLFESLTKLLCESDSRSLYGNDVILLLTVLINYRKYESINPYMVKLSILDSEFILNGYAVVIIDYLSEFCRQFSAQTEIQSVHWLSSLTNIVGNIFNSDDVHNRSLKIRGNNGILLALYEAVHVSRNFMTTLSQTLCVVEKDGCTETESVNNSPTLLFSDTQPYNLLIVVFQYCSIIMQDTASEEGNQNVKLCFLILTCIAEDQYANCIMHDEHMLFKVELYKMPMRHRLPNAFDKPAQTLAATFFDLMIEFIMSHMMKRLPMELYMLSVGIIHRLLCYQKKCSVRINYNWKDIWSSLIVLLKFILSNETHLSRKLDIFNLSLQMVNIFNLFITYGDTFLASPRNYDQLYYEIIRTHDVFENLYSLALKYSPIDGDFKESVTKLITHLINLRAIINHFTPKIDKWIAEQFHCTPTEEQILQILRSNYESLTLKLLDGLDQYERYAESPNHTAFFVSTVRNAVVHTRDNTDYNSLDMKEILHELSLIT